MTETFESYIPDRQQRAELIDLLTKQIDDNDQTVYIHVHGGTEKARAILISAIQQVLIEICSMTTAAATVRFQTLYRPAVKDHFEVLGALKGWIYITPSGDDYVKHAEKNLDHWSTQIRVIMITCGRNVTEMQNLVEEIRSQMV